MKSMDETEEGICNLDFKGSEQKEERERAHFKTKLDANFSP